MVPDSPPYNGGTLVTPDSVGRAPERSSRARQWLARSLPIVAVLAAFSASSAILAAQANQPPRSPRAIDLPDTLGADFSAADSATGKGTSTDWDFLVGLWQFRFQQRYADGTFRPPFSGHWSASQKNADGAMIEDHWRSDNPSSTWDSGTWTYRVFDPGTNLWAIQGVEPQRGRWQPGLTWSDSTSRYVIQHNGTVIMRIRYFNITPNGFSWRADLSRDGGQTWVRDWWAMQVQRVAR
jgi:hypothetical protein